MRHVSLLVAAATLGLGGCVSASSCCDPCAPVAVASVSPPAPASAPTPAPTSAPAPVPSAPARAFALYDGTGAPSSLEAFLAASKDADLVAFGELHGDLVGAEMQRRVLEAMAAGPRPVALALEFVERDVQGALDAYLAGRIPEAEFLKTARQGPAYATTHRPLVEFAKARGLAVIAANAPRRLVTPFRKADSTYPEYLATLSEADRGFLPAQSTLATGPYLERFTKLMGDERGARLIRGQSLWDDAMAEAVASHRAASPDSRVLLIVGGFHVAGRLGTITKYASRRPDDRVAVLVMTHGQPPALAFDPEDRGEGDAILVVRPPPPPAAPAKPAPSAPASNPKP